MRRAVTLLCLLVLVPVAAEAGERMRPWLDLTGTWGRHAMGDVNRDIRSINRELAFANGQLDEITAGFGYGLAAGLDVAPFASVGVGYERLRPSSQVYNVFATFDYDLPADVVRGFGRLNLGLGAATRLWLEGSAGIVSTPGWTRAHLLGDGDADARMSGRGTDLGGALGCDWMAGPTFALTASVGARSTRVSKLDVGGKRVKTADGSDLDLDYSGLVIRTGVKFAPRR